MSIKNLTTAQIQGDLDAIERIWPNGIPVEQIDRITALTHELKLRGAERQRQPAKQLLSPDADADLSMLNEKQLADELAVVGDILRRDPTNDAQQTRFADIRYEIRARARRPPPSVQPREIEIPDAAAAPKTIVAEKGPTQPDPAPRETRDATRRVGWEPVFAARAGGIGVLFTFDISTREPPASAIQVSVSLTIEEAEAAVARYQAAIDQAKKLR